MSGRTALNAAYAQLVDIVGTVSPRTLRPAHAAHAKRLAQVQERLALGRRPVPGLTTHQAKGGEWDVVGVCLTGAERAALAQGLSVSEDTHRKLYVACTRARSRTVEVV
jgi:DNA helicase-2/ATP-dependent DNA helicase PcrA